MNLRLLWFPIVIACVQSCTSTSDDGCVGAPEPVERVNVAFEWIPGEPGAVNSKADLISLFKNREVLRDLFFNRGAYPNDSAFIRELHHRFTNPAFDTLTREVNRVFGDGSALKKQFEDAFSNLKFHYPDFKAPKVVATISGMETDLYLSDSLVIIGLDFYLGRGAKYRPDTYQYMMRRYQPESIVPSVILLTAISDSFNKIREEDKTTLGDMVAYGKAYNFTRFVIPCIPDSTLFGYSPEEAAGALANEGVIWKKLVGDQILFETSHLVKQRYIGERPNVVEISAKCPGRIGMWVGMRMVDQYMKQTGKTLPETMAVADAQEIFKKSGYKPVR
ncbi:MAG: gliding motility lipoprotein GldB [Bacteroidota bacterium]